ncbi:MAG: c-type cytochrome, partial [Planctomycetota bacterium]
MTDNPTHSAPRNPTPGSAQSTSADTYRWHAFGLATLLILTLPVILASLVILKPVPQTATSPWAEVAAELGVEPVHLSAGEALYNRTCAVCHAADGSGIPRLGKPLRNSEYVQSHTDEELKQLVATGRPPTDPDNTTGAPMPPRANNPLLDDDRLSYVVAYLRTMQDPNAPTATLDD